MGPVHTSGNTLFAVYITDNQPWIGNRNGWLLCPRCGARDIASIANQEHNSLLCQTCNTHAHQFINVTPHTINADGSIISAGISDVATRLIQADRLRISNVLDVVLGQDQPVILECRLGEQEREPFFAHRTGLITPPSAHGRWRTSCVVPLQFFPLRETRVVVALTVFNMWGDHLDRYVGSIHTLGLFQRMIDLELPLLETEQRLLALDYQQYKLQGRVRDPRFKDLVLALVDYLLYGVP